ncbi:hypothetical protein V8F20_001270 [Naviculisporaceae sp. PSN 640]
MFIDDAICVSRTGRADNFDKCKRHVTRNVDESGSGSHSGSDDGSLSSGNQEHENSPGCGDATATGNGECVGGAELSVGIIPEHQAVAIVENYNKIETASNKVDGDGFNYVTGNYAHIAGSQRDKAAEIHHQGNQRQEQVSINHHQKNTKTPRENPTMEGLNQLEADDVQCCSRRCHQDFLISQWPAKILEWPLGWPVEPSFGWGPFRKWRRTAPNLLVALPTLEAAYERRMGRKVLQPQVAALLCLVVTQSTNPGTRDVPPQRNTGH